MEVDEDLETRKAKAKNLKRAKDSRINKHMYSKNEPLLISDIIFQMVQSAFNRLDPIIHGFELEVEQLIARAAFSEGPVKNYDRVSRAYRAKEEAYLIALEID